MNRVEKSAETYRRLFGNRVPPFNITDPEYQAILNRFALGDAFAWGNLGEKTRLLIALVVLAAGGSLSQFPAHVEAALNAGAKAEEIKEALYQCTPYVGFPKVIDALNETNLVFARRRAQLPASPQSRTDERDRFRKGLAAQTQIFGDQIERNYATAPASQRHIQEYLTAYCFGDFYTRSGLDLKRRELLTLCVVSALGGCEAQVKAHVRGNVNVGNGKQILIAALTQCLPYIGFPRTLNALACVDAVLPENTVSLPDRAQTV